MYPCPISPALPCPHLSLLLRRKTGFDVNATALKREGGLLPEPNRAQRPHHATATMGRRLTQQQNSGSLLSLLVSHLSPLSSLSLSVIDHMARVTNLHDECSGGLPAFALLVCKGRIRRRKGERKRIRPAFVFNGERRGGGISAWWKRATTKRPFIKFTGEICSRNTHTWPRLLLALPADVVVLLPVLCKLFLSLRLLPAQGSNRLNARARPKGLESFLYNGNGQKKKKRRNARVS